MKKIASTFIDDMKYKYYVLVLIIFTSCSTYKNNDISGFYRTKGGFEWGSSIYLNIDSTFSYKWQVGLIIGVTTGIWSIKNDSLILNSDWQPQEDTVPDYYLIDRSKVDSGEFFFELFFPDTTEALIGANGLMFKNNDTIAWASSDIDGKMLFPLQDFDSIRIYYIGIKSINIVDKDYDYYKIVAVEDSSTYLYEYFTDEKWGILKDTLIDNTENEYYYEKQFYRVKVKNQKRKKKRE